MTPRFAEVDELIGTPLDTRVSPSTTAALSKELSCTVCTHTPSTS
jgi:hypothetical protein